MAEASDPDGSESAPGVGGASPVVDLALGEALKRQGRTYDPVDALLEDQRALIGDQRDYLREQLRHLSLKSVEQRIAVALSLLAVAAGAAVVLALGAVAWNAHNAAGVVVETFAAPPDLAAHGLSGEVLAARFVDRLAAARRTVRARCSGRRAPWTCRRRAAPNWRRGATRRRLRPVRLRRPARAG